MSGIKLKRKMLLSFISVIAFFGLCISLFVFFIVQKHIVGRAQRQVSMDLKTARAVYNKPFQLMQASFDMYQTGQPLERLKENLQLNYLFVLDKDKIDQSHSPIVRQAAEQGQGRYGTRVIPFDAVARLDPIEAPSYVVEIKPTPKAHPTEQKTVRDVMALEYAKPLRGPDGQVSQVLCGGIILTRNFSFIDEIVNVVFENKMYKDKPVGTVTIFQDDVRIATNVLDRQGQRAIGTRVSDIVYNQVVEQGVQWNDRAFVVTDWYITAYEPIKDIAGHIVGILYVGILEKPYQDMQRNISLQLITIIILAFLLAVGIAVLFSDGISRQITSILQTTRRIAGGDLAVNLRQESDIEEFNALVAELNEMSDRLVQREESLAESNQKLSVLNKRYLDLIGFVSHELKGLLSSIVLNTYLLEQGIIGPINAKQKKILQSIARNLDYLTVTVKNFLNLSRVEKEELVINKTELLLREHLFDISSESFMNQAREKGLSIDIEISADLMILGDPGLLQIVVNNLMSNAIKYAAPQGRIHITAKELDDEVEIRVYNDGTPIAAVDVDKLFKKFSRIVYRGQEKVKGTGIGLFISKEIIERHGGRIWVEPQEQGNTFLFRIKKK